LKKGKLFGETIDNQTNELLSRSNACTTAELVLKHIDLKVQC